MREGKLMRDSEGLAELLRSSEDLEVIRDDSGRGDYVLRYSYLARDVGIIRDGVLVLSCPSETLGYLGLLRRLDNLDGCNYEYL